MPIKIQSENVLKNFKEGFIGVNGANKKLKQALIGINGVNKELWKKLGTFNSKWSVPMSGSYIRTGVLHTSGDIYVGDNASNVIKVNSYGVKQWTKKPSDYGKNQIVYNYNNNTITVVETSKGVYNYDTSGNLKWTYTLLSADGGQGFGIAIGNDGNYYVATNLAKMVKISPSGTKLSVMTIPITPSKTSALYTLSSGYFLLVGDSSIYKINQSGTKQWECLLGHGTGNLSIDSNETIYVYWNKKLTKVLSNGTVDYVKDVPFYNYYTFLVRNENFYMSPYGTNALYKYNSDFEIISELISPIGRGYSTAFSIPQFSDFWIVDGNYDLHRMEEID